MSPTPATMDHLARVWSRADFDAWRLSQPAGQQPEEDEAGLWWFDRPPPWLWIRWPRRGSGALDAAWVAHVGVHSWFAHARWRHCRFDRAQRDVALISPMVLPPPDMGMPVPGWGIGVHGVALSILDALSVIRDWAIRVAWNEADESAASDAQRGLTATPAWAREYQARQGGRLRGLAGAPLGWVDCLPRSGPWIQEEERQIPDDPWAGLRTASPTPAEAHVSPGVVVPYRGRAVGLPFDDAAQRLLDAGGDGFS